MMCGRFYVALDDPELMEIIKEIDRKNREEGREAPEIKRGEVFPTNQVAALRRGGNLAERAIQLQWGFSKFDGRGQIINARSETALEKPMFRKPVLENRCIIPASYYYEWQTEGTKKTRNLMRDPRGERLYMAGMYRHEKDSDVPRMVILTRDAAPQIAQVHNRMPVIFDLQEREEWLSANPDYGELMRRTVERIQNMPLEPGEI